jgi:hypothetical protein
MRRVEPDPDESRRKLWRAENSLTTHARCSPPGLSRIASLIGKIQACRPLDHSSGANGCFTSCGGNAHADREWQLATLSGHSASHSERLFLSLRGHPDLEATVAARGDLVAGLPVDPDAADIGHEDAWIKASTSVTSGHTNRAAVAEKSIREPTFDLTGAPVASCAHKQSNRRSSEQPRCCRGSGAVRSQPRIDI